MAIILTFLHPQATLGHLGPVPGWLDENDPEPAAKQFDRHYQHGGGWQPMPKFTMPDRTTGVLTYPGDPPFRPFAAIMFRKEMIFVYDHAIFAILQPDGSIEVARMD